MMNRSNIRSRLKNAIFIFIWLLIWELADRMIDNPILLSGPLETLRRLFSLIPEESFRLSVFMSLSRIMAGFFLSAVLAVILGFISYFLPLIREFLSPFISLMKAIPVASFVILALICLHGSMDLSLVVTFIVTFPLIWDSVISGLSSSDQKLLELSEVFHMNMPSRLRYIYVPAVLPYLSSSLSSVMGMAWKSGVAAELIGQPKDTIGFYLYQSKVFLDTTGVLAWTFTVILLSYVCERLLALLFRLISKRL